MAQAARSSAVRVRSILYRRLPTWPAEPAPQRPLEHLKAAERVLAGNLAAALRGPRNLQWGRRRRSKRLDLGLR